MHDDGRGLQGHGFNDTSASDEGTWAGAELYSDGTAHSGEALGMVFLQLSGISSATEGPHTSFGGHGLGGHTGGGRGLHQHGLGGLGLHQHSLGGRGLHLHGGLWTALSVCGSSSIDPD